MYVGDAYVGLVLVGLGGWVCGEPGFVVGLGFLVAALGVLVWRLHFVFLCDFMVVSNLRV